MLVLAVAVLPDDGGRRVQDDLRRAIIPFELDDVRLWEVALEIENVPQVGAPPLVNRLIRVANDAQVPVHFGKPANQEILRTIRVLVFVHHHEPELFRVFRANSFRLLEQVHSLQQQIIEVERVALSQRLQVVVVHLRDLRIFLIPARRCGDHARIFHPVFRMADSRQRRTRLHERIVDVQLLERLLDDGQLIGGVVDDEVARQPDRRRLATQQPRAEGMERRHPHAAAVRPEQVLDTRPHFFGGFVRECDGENFVRLGVAVADEVRDAARDDARLARSGAREDEKRSFDLEDCFALFRIERIEEVQSHHSTVTDFARLRG